jgi:hypothetical protein
MLIMKESQIFSIVYFSNYVHVFVPENGQNML